MEQEYSLFEYYTLTKNPNVLICYRGPVTPIILKEISKDIRVRFSNNIQVSKKIFAIYMELAQNIHYYSSEKINLINRKDSIGTILLTQNDKFYKFSFGNLIENHYLDEILDTCDEINSKDREELREFKREKRSAPRGERSKGGGIGLIQVALTSRNPLKVEHRAIDPEHSFLSLTVSVSKEFGFEGDEES